MRKLACRKLLLLIVFSVSLLTVSSQSTVVTGSVSDAEKGTPLAGVTIKVQGTAVTAVSQENGKYSIKASAGQVLTFSYVGYESKRVTLKNQTSVNVELKSVESDLEDVVVVAMDQKRKPRELGYSTQQVSGAEIQETQRDNFVNALAGRVAGATVNPTSGTLGSSSQIVLRGFNSLSQGNGPIFVVDGIITDNSVIDENSSGGQSVGLASDRSNRQSDYTNRMADLNPNDIASLTILKGPEATALYGSQASSGAIVITTRRAKTNKLAVQYDNSFRIQSVYRLPPTIDEFGPGVDGQTSLQFRYFGPAYPAGTKKFNNVNAFFRTGFSQTHNLGVDFGIKKSIFRFSTSYLDAYGVLPNNNQKRINLSLRNTTKIGKTLELTPSIAFTNTNLDKPTRGAGGYMLALYTLPNTIDIAATAQDAGGNKVPIFLQNVGVETDNPFFNVNNNQGKDITDRILATFGINYNPLSWLSFSGRFGYDYYKTIGSQFYHPQSTAASAASVRGIQDNFWRTFKGYNHTITATARKQISKNFSGRVMLGTMWQESKFEMFAITGNNIADPRRRDSNNTNPSSRIRLLQNDFGRPNLNLLRQIAFFGELSVGYKNIVFLNYTHRAERASTLPEQNRNYNYPGMSLSAIMSDVFPRIKRHTVINYWKLRTSMAQTARLNSPYSTQSVFVNNFASANGPAFSYGFFNNAADLTPEKQSTYEIGTEIKLFNGRINIDATYYNTLIKGQIIENMRLSYGTGFVLNTQNAASTRNEGIELALDGDVIRNKDFSWNLRLNFNRMWNKIVAFPANVSEFYIADTWLYNNARASVFGVGSPTTGIGSWGYLRNNNGQILISPTTGLPITDQTFRLRGDRNPVFTTGIQNNLKYKNWRLTMLWDLRIGGDVFNATNMYLTNIGRSPVTADRYTPRIVTGVLNDAFANSATPNTNTIVVIPAYNDAYYAANQMPEEAFIEKGINWLRLRDITLSYALPPNKLKKINGLKSASLFITANDLILLTNYSGADPAVSGTSAATRGVGTQGFDYGTLANPLGVNFGIRLGF